MSLSCTNDRYVYDGRICQTIAQMMTRGGITTAVELNPGSVFMSRTRADKNESPMLLYAISLSSLRDAAYILGLVAHSRDDGGGFGDGNRGSFSDPALDKIIEAAIIRSDPGREAALQEASRQTVARLGMIPLYAEFTIAAARAPASPTRPGWTSNSSPKGPARRTSHDQLPPDALRHQTRRFGRTLLSDSRRVRDFGGGWQRCGCGGALRASPWGCCCRIW